MRICLMNLHRYNEGELVCKWVELPASDDEIIAVKHAIEISTSEKCFYDEFGCIMEEMIVCDYDCSFNCAELGEYTPVDRWNEIAEAVEDCGEEMFAAIVELDGIDEAVEHYDEWFCVDCSNDRELGEYYAEEIDCLRMPSIVERYFDYEAYGRDCRDSEYCSGYVNGKYYARTYW